MSRTRTPLEIAAGKLVSAIQHEWHDEAGEPESCESEVVMHASHALLQVAPSGSLVSVVGEGSVTKFLGQKWVQNHPRVWPHIQVLEAMALGESDA